MSKKFELAAKEDLRLHVDQYVVIDLSEEIIRITERLMQRPDVYPILPPKGYYLPDSDTPVLLDDNTYYYIEKGARRIFKKPTGVVGAIYDTNMRVIVPQEKVRYLRTFPNDIPAIKSLVTNWVDHDITYETEYKELINYRVQSIDRLILEHVAPQLPYKDEDFVLPDEIEQDMYFIMDVLEERLERIPLLLGRNNPWMLFRINLNRGILRITALIDYRVSEWEQQQLVLEEHFNDE